MNQKLTDMTTDYDSSQQNPTQDRSMSRFEVLKKNAETTKLEAARAKKEMEDAENEYNKYVSDTFTSLIGKKVEIRYVPINPCTGFFIAEGEVYSVKSHSWLANKFVTLKNGEKYSHIGFRSIKSWKVLE